MHQSTRLGGPKSGRLLSNHKNFPVGPCLAFTFPHAALTARLAGPRLGNTQLLEHPLCKYCLERGTVTPAEICDHVELRPATSTKGAPMSIRILIEVLRRMPESRLTKDVPDKLLHLLEECWRDFRGSSEASMHAWKLDRAEDFSWKSPLFSFRIERHGATVLGSSRADLQRWVLNLTTREAQCSKESYLQIRPASGKLDVKPIASRVCETIREGSG